MDAVILIAYVLAPLPLTCSLARPATRSSATLAARQLSTGPSFSRPLWCPHSRHSFVLWHVGVVPAGSALMALAGFLLVCVTAGLAIVFSRADYGGESWGGGVALFGS